MSKFSTLVTKLREVFQIDRPDLDFGIYRIMNARAEQITRYLEHDLREKVAASLGEGQSAELSETREKLAEAQKNATSLGMDPDMVPAVKDLTAKLTLLEAQAPGHEDAVFSHLLTFFSRYYEKGDYISKRRYKGDTYAIPYSGEEVVLHWANKDQYYIKSGESFTNYSFKLDDGRRVRFQLLSADTAKDNRKDNEENRLFALIPPDYSLTKTDDEGEEITTNYDPITEDEKGDLIIHFTYQGYPKSVKKKDKNADSLKQILRHDLVTTKWTDLHTRKPTEKNKDRTLLESHLTTYTEKNSSDYFIHKDLGRFLRHELDFYIKNEVMHLDDLQNAETFDALKDNLRLIQTLREIALDLIRFLAQLEDFQKKLWLKKKFVTQTDYALTLDRIPASLYPEIATNQTQHDEWLQLYAIDEIEAVKGDLAKEDTAGYSTPLTVEFLQQNPHLVLDTVHFPEEFKAQLLNAIPNLDESLDGLAIHSENFQALNLLQEQYREKVKCVYIDPPYNTGNDGFIYRDQLQHSSWMTMTAQSLSLSSSFLNNESSFFTSIDDHEVENYKIILSQRTYNLKFVANILWQKRYAPDIRTSISDAHEHILTFAPCPTIFKSIRSKLPLTDFQTKQFKNPDKDPRGPWKSKDFTAQGYRPNQMYELTTPSGNIVTPPEGRCWATIEENFEKLKNDNRMYFGKDGGGLPGVKRFLSDVDGVTPWTWWSHQDAGHSQDGLKATMSLFGRGGAFVTAKPPKLLERILTIANVSEATTLDYFAGSGTTGHAVINLNREDGGKRKYILVEMGDHFDTVLCPRLKKVAYSANWKEGKPTTRDSEISHGFKYLRLESYEDVLNNLQLPKDSSDLLRTTMGADYQLGYMLDVEARASLLSVADFQKPFDYQLNIATDSSGASEPRSIDLIETFNYLIGLTVEHYDRNLEQGYAKLTGTLPSGEKTLILWRDCEKIGYEELDELCKKWDISPRQKKYDLVYLNGDHNLPNVLEELAKDGGSTQELRLRQIEPEFLDRMFAEN